MHRFTLLTTMAATIFSMSAAIPVSAKTPDGFSFRDLEYSHGASGAARIGRAEVAKLIPIGMPVDDAVVLMREAGARCGEHGDEMRCYYTAFEAVEEMPHDLVWTVDLTVAGGQVARVGVRRDSLGG